MLTSSSHRTVVLFSIMEVPNKLEQTSDKLQNKLLSEAKLKDTRQSVLLCGVSFQNRSEKNKKEKKQNQRTLNKQAICFNLHKAKLQRKTQLTLPSTPESSSSSSPAMAVAALLLRAARTTPGNSYRVFRFLQWMCLPMAHLSHLIFYTDHPIMWE